MRRKTNSLDTVVGHERIGGITESAAASSHAAMVDMGDASTIKSHSVKANTRDIMQTHTELI